MKGEAWTPEEIEMQKEITREVVKKCEEQLAAEFVQGLRDRDWAWLAKIIRAAKTMSAFKEKSDRLRLILLSVKISLDKRGEKRSIRQVSEIVGWPKENNQDGFAYLRRVCKELKFPLARSR